MSLYFLLCDGKSILPLSVLLIRTEQTCTLNENGLSKYLEKHTLSCNVASTYLCILSFISHWYKNQEDVNSFEYSWVYILCSSLSVHGEQTKTVECCPPLQKMFSKWLECWLKFQVNKLSGEICRQMFLWFGVESLCKCKSAAANGRAGGSTGPDSTSSSFLLDRDASSRWTNKNLECLSFFSP